MGTNRKIFESQLYDIWKKKQYESELKTVDGEDVDILDIVMMVYLILHP